MGTSSDRLAAVALECAREQINELGEAAAWQRLRDDRIAWRLARNPEANPRALFQAGLVLVSAERGRPSPVTLLSARFVVEALLLVLVRHGRPASSPGPASVSAPRRPRPATDNGDVAAPSAENGGDPLARALAALGEACGQARSRPALLRELRRLHHGLARVRGAVVQSEKTAIRQERRARPSGPPEALRRVQPLTG